MTDIEIKKLDTAPTQRWRLDNADGPQNLTGATVTMILEDGRSFDVDVDSPTTGGIVSLDVSEPAVAAAVGKHQFEFLVVYADLTQQRFPSGLDRPSLVVHPIYEATP